MGSKKYLRHRLCDCERYFPVDEYYSPYQREKIRRSSACSNNCYLFLFIFIHFLSTIRPLFFISYDNLLEPCNSTNVLPFDQFEKLVNDYIRLKTILNNIQISQNLEAITHYHQSYSVSRFKAFEDLIKAWVITEDTYKIQQKKYEECYEINRNNNYESLQQLKWLICTYSLLTFMYCFTNIQRFIMQKQLSKADYKLLLIYDRPGFLSNIGTFFVAFSAPLPGYFLPKAYYFLHYWFIVDGYIGL